MGLILAFEFVLPLVVCGICRNFVFLLGCLIVLFTSCSFVLLCWFWLIVSLFWIAAGCYFVWCFGLFV